MSKTIQIAIDGPAGAGKSTVAKALAAKLGYIYIDTGAMYRAITLIMLENDIALTDEERISDILKTVKITFGDSMPDGRQKVYCNAVDCTEKIRSPEVSRHVSEVSALPIVRRALVDKQRQIAGENNVIMDGRDIGTVVLPHAQHKFFLTATLEERTRRRSEEMRNAGMAMDFDVLKNEIAQRDEKDSQRIDSPLKAADDAVLIDTSKMSLDEVIENLFSRI